MIRYLVTAHAADVLTFWFAIAVVGLPLAAESNPLSQHLYLTGGILLLAAFKAAVVVAVVGLASRCSRPLFREFALTVGLFGGVLGAASNVLAAARWATL